MVNGGPPARRQVNPDPSPEFEEAVQITRFWRLVNVGGHEECWDWRGDQNGGYGAFYYRGRMRRAHELALSFTTGESRHPDLDTCHECDNPACCNPAHLRFDTRKSNVGDMHSRGRGLRGDSHPSATRMTSEKVRLMRERRALGATQRTLAEDFGVSEGYVSEIVRGLVWKSAPGPIQKKMFERKVA